MWCAATLPRMVLYKLFLDTRVPLLGSSDEPNEEQTVKKGAGPSEPNEEHTGKGGWAEVTLQPPVRVAFWGFCDVVKVTTIDKLI